MYSQSFIFITTYFFFFFWLVLNICSAGIWPFFSTSRGELGILAVVLLVVLIPVLVLFVVPLWNAPQQAFTFAAFLDLLSPRLGSVEAQFSLVQHNFGLVCFGLVFFCLCSGLQHNLSLARGKRFIMFVCSFVPSFVRWFVCLFVRLL